MHVLTALLPILFCGIFCVNGEVKRHGFKTSVHEILDKWWQTAAIYQIYPRSFKDSDNDGNGDLQGVIQKLDYLQDTGFDAIWLNPIFKSPQVDGGYDVTDYRDIDPMYGTLDDLRQLVDEAHKRDIKVILDYVPNHTSDQHEWFQASVKQDPKYDNYYIWRNATYVDGERRPPNNWISWFSGPAWEWNEDRQQYYFHQFSTGQPDLNYRNPAVVEEMTDVLRYWLYFGVDGLRMGAVTTLYEDESLRDEPESGISGLTPNDHDYLNHIYTVDQRENFDMIYQWREVVDQFNQQNNTYDRILIAEGNANPRTVELLYGTGNGSRLGAHLTFNFITFFELDSDFSATDISDSIRDWCDILPQVLYSYIDANWLLGNHDNWRVATRLGVENIDVLNIMVSLLPGTQITYQGEEIGQENGEVTCEEGTDPRAIKNCSTFDIYSRDFERTPFQWDNSTNAGFNNGTKPWLPISEKYVQTNLAKQNVPNINSHYNIFKEMLNVRRILKNTTLDAGMMWGYSGNVSFIVHTNENMYYGFVYNTGESDALPYLSCTHCTVVVRSFTSDYAPGDLFNNSQPLKPKEAVLIQTPRHT